MQVSERTLDHLASLFSDGFDQGSYKSGPKLIEFFNILGENDLYENFPSRRAFTKEKLCLFNNREQINRCIESYFCPINFIGNAQKLEELTKELNEYLQFNDLVLEIKGKRAVLREIRHDTVEVTNSIHNYESVHLSWEKALNRKQDDPEGAITSARTLIESTCKHILDELNAEYNDGADLPVLYKQVCTELNLAPNQHTEEIFKQILGGCTSVVLGLGSLRNKVSDAHGKGKTPVKPSVRHAELAVNLAGSMASFFISTFEEKRK